MSKPVVLIAEELSAATIDVLGSDFEIRHVDGADRSALIPALADAQILVAILGRFHVKKISLAFGFEVLRIYRRRM